MIICPKLPVCFSHCNALFLIGITMGHRNRCLLSIFPSSSTLILSCKEARIGDLSNTSCLFLPHCLGSTAGWEVFLFQKLSLIETTNHHHMVCNCFPPQKKDKTNIGARIDQITLIQNKHTQKPYCFAFLSLCFPTESSH